MQDSDLPEFKAQLAPLFAGFNVPVTAERIEGYWAGLKRMGLPLLARAVENALSEAGPERLPTPPQLWRIARKLRAPGANETTPPDAAFLELQRIAAKDWDKRLRAQPLTTKLMLADALWARYSVERDQESVILAEKREWLKGRVRSLLAEYSATWVAENFEIWRLRLQVLAIDSGARFAVPKVGA